MPMFYVHGWKVIVADGGKNMTVNLRSPDRTGRGYDAKIRLPSGTTSEEKLKDRRFSSPEALYQHVSGLSGAEVEIALPSKHTNPRDAGRTLVDLILERLKNNRVIAFVIVACFIVIGIGAVTGALESVLAFIDTRVNLR